MRSQASPTCFTQVSFIGKDKTVDDEAKFRWQSEERVRINFVVLALAALLAGLTACVVFVVFFRTIAFEGALSAVDTFEILLHHEVPDCLARFDASLSLALILRELGRPSEPQQLEVWILCGLVTLFGLGCHDGADG
jgi:hypothetical protein